MSLPLRLSVVVALAAVTAQAQVPRVLEVIESDEPYASLDLGETLVRGLNQPWSTIQPRVVPPDSGTVSDGAGTVWWRVPDFPVDWFVAEVRGGYLREVLLDFSEGGPEFGGYSRRLRDRHGAPARDGFYPAASLGTPFDVAVDAEAGALRFRAVAGRLVPADTPLPIRFRAVEAPPRPSPPPRDPSRVHDVVESPPEIVNGYDGLLRRVAYPPDALAEGVGGTVLVQFVVNTDGASSDHVVLRSPDDRLSAAAVEAIRGTRFWPGHLDGLPVRTRITVPVRFAP